MINNGIINFNNVSYKYPRCTEFALQDVNLSATKAQFFAVMGKTGAGKTTFCRLINGIIPQLFGGKLSGTVSIDGVSTTESSVAQLALKIGMVLDDPDTQLFTSTVRAEAAFGPENLLLPLQEINKRVDFTLSATGLSSLQDRKPSTLSGGEKQRLVIASVLAMQSKILVLDDPLCGLDPKGAMDVLSVLENLKNNFKFRKYFQKPKN